MVTPGPACGSSNAHHVCKCSYLLWKAAGMNPVDSLKYE